MTKSSQQLAADPYRRRLTERGMARFDVLRRDADREFVRSIARRLAEAGPQETRLRTAIPDGTAGEQPRRGRVLEALRRSPLVGQERIPSRPIEYGRSIYP